MKELRGRALARPLDTRATEAVLDRAVAALRDSVAAGRDEAESLSASEGAVAAKLERRRAELQRAEKRLHTVQKIKSV